MAFRPFTEDTIRKLQDDIVRYEARANSNKRRADICGALIIVLGALTGIVVATPDAVLGDLSGFDLTSLRQILPVLTAAAYAALRYHRWGDKHLWYWYQRHRLQGLLVRNTEGN